MKPILYFLLLLLISISCEYPLNDIYNRKVNQEVSAPNIQVVELNLDTDTLYVYGNFGVKFKFTTDNQAIQRVSLLIDGIEKGSVESNTGTFYVDCVLQSSGMHDLTIRIYTNTGTGSLAEELGQEMFIGYRTWKLVVNHSGYNPKIDFRAIDGLLHVSWTACMASNFKEYRVYKYDDDYNKIPFIRTSKSEFVDSSYVGEGTVYLLETVTTEDEIIGSRKCYLDTEPPILTFWTEFPDKYFLKWNIGKYYNAIDSVLIFQGLSYADFTLLKRIADLKDTVYMITNGKFFSRSDYFIRLVPHAGNRNYVRYKFSGFEAQASGYIGFPFRPQNSFTYCFRTGTDEFVFSEDDGLNKFSLTKGKIVETINHTPGVCGSFLQKIFISNTGQYLAALALCDEQTFIFARSDDLHSYKSRRNISVSAFNDYYAVSDNGMLVYQNYFQGGFDYYDLEASKKWHYPVANNYNFAGDIKISSDASHFMFVSDSFKMVSVSSNTFSVLWKVKYDPEKIKFYEFDPHDPGQFFLWDGINLSFSRSSDMSVIRQIPLADVRILDIDYDNQEILTWTSGHLLVRSLDDGSLKYDLPVDLELSLVRDPLLLINHAIVYENGLINFLH